MIKHPLYHINQKKPDFQREEPPTMTTYRIDIYSGWSVYDSLVSREYKQFKCVDDAKIYAYSKIEGTQLGYSINEVA